MLLTCPGNFLIKQFLRKLSQISNWQGQHKWTLILLRVQSPAKRGGANPRHNLTEMLHVLSEQTGMKLSCIKPTSKVRGLSIEPCSSTVCID